MKDKKFKQLKLKQLSDSINKKSLLSIDQITQRLRDIRESLGMTQKQLAKRLNISQQEICKIENNKQSCSLKTINKVASALNCEFKCVIVSNESLEKIIYKQAEKKADQILKRSNANMAMEEQAVEKQSLKFQRQKLVEELASEANSILWEE